MPNDHEMRFAADDYQSAENRDFTTDAIHGGYHGRSSSVPIYQGNTNYSDGYEGTNSYGRGLDKAGGPTSGAHEEQVRILEGAEWAQATSCGMAAVSQTLFGLLRSGDRVVYFEPYAHSMEFIDLAPAPPRWPMKPALWWWLTTPSCHPACFGLFISERM